MKKYYFLIYLIVAILIFGCQPPPKKKKETRIKHNYIILVDLSDRLIVQPDQPERDKQIIQSLFELFEQKVKKEMYIRSRDELKVVIAPQKGSNIRTDIYEDQMYVNMDNIPKIFRKSKEEERKTNFMTSLDKLYEKAVFSKDPKKYYGADIWKYFYEDLKSDYANDTLTRNFLFILTDGYPIVGKNLKKLPPVKETFPELEIILLEGCPREKDMEWDRVMSLWTEWFDNMNIEKHTYIKRRAISKVKEQIKDILK